MLYVPYIYICLDSLEALISYAHRAETVMNRCLKDKSFYEVATVATNQNKKQNKKQNEKQNEEMMEKYLRTSFFDLEIIGSHKV